MLILFSLFIAVWLKAEIPRFAIRVNRQIYQETTSLVNIGLTEQQFWLNRCYNRNNPDRQIYFFSFFH
ncbi:hypothetical protein [Mannheimia haemolytica]|uniref:hypothetical protein n=1 Tax=Mannheimia haemolytica TaxID=75985 RepID=UPI001EFF1649|nr:hypothetical protein [Mannheimia haemolytica]